MSLVQVQRSPSPSIIDESEVLVSFRPPPFDWKSSPARFPALFVLHKNESQTAQRRGHKVPFHEQSVSATEWKIVNTVAAENKEGQVEA